MRYLLHLHAEEKGLPLLLFIILVNAVFCNPCGFLQACGHAWIHKPRTCSILVQMRTFPSLIFLPLALWAINGVQQLHLLVPPLLPASIIIIGSLNLHFVMIPSPSVSLYFTSVHVFFVEENLFTVLRAVKWKITYWIWTPTYVPLMEIVASTTLSWTKINIL